MSVRFEPAARRAIDGALIEVERRGHAVLDTLHLLFGVLGQADGAAVPALRLLGVDPEQLRSTVARDLREQEASAHAALDIAGATERILAHAHRISTQVGADAVSDLDVLLACAQEHESLAGKALAEATVTPPRLWGVYPEARGYLAVRPATDAGAPSPAQVAPSDRAPAGPVVLTRSGIGYDSHRFGPGGPLVLGGLSIPSDVRLVGHSDGDAIAHAVTDAILGAAAAGDIGEMFSDLDPANAGRDSIEMLRAAVRRVHEHGYSVHHVDVTVVTERPKIAPHRAAMREALARALEVPAAAVSVKGKTNEGMGWIGRGEGLACMAVATLVAGRSDR